MQVLFNSRKRAAPPSATATDAKKRHISGTDGTEAPQDPATNDHMYVELCASFANDVINVWI